MLVAEVEEHPFFLNVQKQCQQTGKNAKLFGIFCYNLRVLDLHSD